MKSILSNIKKDMGLWFNGFLLTMLPVFEFTIDVLPHAQEFLPDNIYRIVGAIAVIGNMYINRKNKLSGGTNVS